VNYSLKFNTSEVDAYETFVTENAFLNEIKLSAFRAAEGRWFQVTVEL